MGTETTSASYRRTQNPLVTKFFYGITGIQRNWQRTLVTNPSFQTQFFYHLINASRNIFLDALVAAFINGTWPLINSTYQFLFPDNSFCHGFLQALYRRLSEPHRFVSNVCCRFLCIPVIPQINFVTRRYKHVGMRLAYFACPYPYAFVKRECPRDAKFICGIIGIQKKCQQHLTQTNLKIYWKIHCESTILDIYKSRLAK